MSMIANFVAIRPEQLQAFVDDPDTLTLYLYSEDEAELQHHLDVDKAWDAIHFLLNGDPEGAQQPLADAVLGGTELGEDNGYGPVRYLDRAAVAAVANALDAIPPDTLAARFEFDALHAAGIYPQIWDRRDDEDRAYVCGHYSALRDFYRAAAERGDCALLYLD